MTDGDVFITGCGIISPLGAGTTKFWSKVCSSPSLSGAGRSGFRLCDFRPEEVLGSSGLRRVGRTNGILLAAAAEALGSSGGDFSGEGLDDFGVVTATATATAEDFMSFQQLLAAADEKSKPGELLGLYRNLFANAAAANIGIRFGLKGLGASVWGGDLAGIEALDYALRLILLGRVKAIVVAAIELQTPLLCAILSQRQLEDRSSGMVCRELRQDGGVSGEAAVALVLEASDGTARQRSRALARIVALARAGVTADRRLDLAIRRAAADALAAAEWETVDAIIAGASGSYAEAEAEGKAMAELFRCRVAIPAVAPKLAVGDCYSASGPLATAFGALALQSQTIAPTPLWSSLDPLRERLSFFTTAQGGRFSKALVNIYGDAGAFAMVLGSSNA